MQQHAVRLQYKVAKDKLLARKVVLLLRHILSTLFANAILLLRHHRHRQSFAASFKRLIYFWRNANPAIAIQATIPSQKKIEE
ncbi:hypothetical protein [Chromobacterium vaccinii]|uniref:hypothetical protein n=1 Tax=Chromobacterium vaccinii TaxID=1108595 RepID=UPI0016419FA5|nr:hypothetical protein [Chromobacterium vaccinii]